MISQPVWYRRTEEALGPYQGVVILGLMAIIAISILLILSNSATARTAWFTYLVMP